MILNIKKIIFIICAFIGYYFFYVEYKNLINDDFTYLKNKTELTLLTEKKKELKTSNNEVRKVLEKNKDQLTLNKIEIIVKKGNSLSSILRKFDFSDKRIYEIINAIKIHFNPKKLKINDKIYFYKNDNGKVKKIVINLDIDSILVINLENKINIQKKELDKYSYQLSYEFKIIDSLYADGLKNDLPADILIKLIKLFSFDLDFQRDIKEGTIVSVSYEFDQILESNNIEYKDILYALISIDGKKLEYFKFITDEGFVDYFNREGKNVKKSILKTPLDGARLSSAFGMRKHPISGYNKMHKGVDFAAPKGTPIYAGGNGVIEYVGNNGGYGKYIRIRHNNEYKTAYAHLSAYKKGISVGKRVNQGDIIGYVGSTGKSTGPHLHYEIIFQNKQINPLKLKLPSGKILQGEEMKRFSKEYKKLYATHLNLLYE